MENQFICMRCNGTTFRAMGIWSIQNPELGIDGCYMRFNDGRWERGCCYGQAESVMQRTVDRIIEGSNKQTDLSFD